MVDLKYHELRSYIRSLLSSFMNFRRAFILIVVLASRSPVYAQDLTSPLAATATPVLQKLPDENGAWALDLVTSGGFDGMGIGKFSVNSSGMLICSSTRHKCPDKLTATALNSLADKVKAAAAVPWKVSAERGLCSDCVVVRLQLSMRQPDGSSKTFIASWDTASQGVPEQLRAILNTLTDFAR
jgi:hypothetical protein